MPDGRQYATLGADGILTADQRPPGGGAVDSVNGQTGTVVLDASDVGATPAGGYVPGGTDVAVADGGTGASTAADARTALGLGTAAVANTGDFDAAGAAAAVTTTSIGAVPTSRTITAGTGLTGGGDLTTNRTISPDFGTGAGKVTEGNDSRLADSRAPSGAAGGDLSGTYPNPSVVDDSHAHTASTLPAPPTVPAFATPSVALGTAAAAGAASTVIRSDSTIVAFDATVPVTQAYDDVAATGAATVAARRDHKHGMPSASGATYATPALTLGTSNAAGAASTGIRSDASVAVFDATVPAAVGTAAAGSAAVAARRDHVHATGAGTPSTQAFGDAAAIGTGPAAAMTDHKHAMPANPVSGSADYLFLQTRYR